MSPLALALLFAAAPGAPDTEPPHVDEAKAPPGEWSLAVVPRFSLSSDDGAGLGFRGTAFWHRWNQQPYKTAISFQLFGTTNLVQQHYLRVDALDAFNVPVRLTAEVGFFATLSANYCGLGDDNPCGRRSIARVVSGLPDPPGGAQRFVQRYYKARFLQPYGTGTARFRFGDPPFKPEVFLTWAGRGYIPGTLLDEDGDGTPDLYPYPESAFARAYPSGQPGFASVLEVGASLDTRDFEPDPRRGFFAEVALRGASPWIGSAWTFGGANASVRAFIPLGDERLVLALRGLVDVVVGDVPYFELVRTGGSETEWIYGGSEVGRGIRQQRYAGRLKAALQQEVRWRFAEVEVLEQHLGFMLAPFFDAGIVSAEVLPSRAPRLLWGAGLALRVAWNRAFVMRVDGAVSAEERYRPALYTLPDHPY